MAQQFPDPTTASPYQSSPSPVKKKHGCFFYGCLTAIIVLLLLAIGIYVGSKWVGSKLVERFTTTQALVLPTSDVSSEEYSAIVQRYDSFKEAVSAGRAAQSLSLNTREINALIEKHKDFEGARGNVYVDIVGNQIFGKVNISLDKLGYPGRFLTGDGAFTVGLAADTLVIKLKKLTISGTQIPDEIMKALSNENLAEKIYENPKDAELIRKFKTLEVADGVLRLGS